MSPVAILHCNLQSIYTVFKTKVSSLFEVTIVLLCCPTELTWGLLGFFLFGGKNFIRTNSTPVSLADYPYHVERISGTQICVKTVKQDSCNIICSGRGKNQQQSHFISILCPRQTFQICTPLQRSMNSCVVHDQNQHSVGNGRSHLTL